MRVNGGQGKNAYRKLENVCEFKNEDLESAHFLLFTGVFLSDICIIHHLIHEGTET